MEKAHVNKPIPIRQTLLFQIQSVRTIKLFVEIFLKKKKKKLFVQILNLQVPSKADVMPCMGAIRKFSLFQVIIRREVLRQSTDCTFLQEREHSSCDVIIILGFCLFFSFLNNDFRFLITIFCSFALFGFCITNGTRATWPWVPCVAPHYQFHMPVQL